MTARSIVLPGIALDALQQQLQQQDEWKTTAGDAWEDWGLVFTGETGNPLFASTVQHALKRECARLELPILTPHSLRHLHASLLIAKGVPITAVSARLGHANPQVTLKIYAHALAGQDRQAADAISDALSKRNTSTQHSTGDKTTKVEESAEADED
jgi:integrase